MRKFVLSVAIVLGLSTPVLADDLAGSGSGSAIPETASTVSSGSSSAAALTTPAITTDSTVPPAPEKSLEEQLKEAQAAYQAIKNSTPDKKDLAIAAFIAVLMNLLLTGVKKVMKLTDKAKKWLPFVALGLGLVIAVLQKYALGGGWVQALIYGGAGPGAVFVQELFNLFRKPTTPSQSATATA